MSRPHLVFVAFWFPPSRASGVYRALATVRAFADAGWDVTVLTCDEEYLHDVIGSVDTSLVDRVPDNVDVVRVPFPRASVIDTSVDSISRLKAYYPGAWRRARNLWKQPRVWREVLRGRHVLSYRIVDNYVAWIQPVVRSIRRIAAHRNVDLILATGNPFSSFEAARVAAELVDRPFIVDYRDPWTIDVFTGRRANVTVGTREGERRIVEQAAACVHVNTAIADAYGALYPSAADRQHVVYNGFDEDALPQLRATQKGGAIRFGILGTVNDRWPLDPIFDAWRSVRSRLPAGSEFILGGHLGYFERSKDALVDRLPSADEGFRYLGPVPKAEVSDFYGTLDALIVPAPGGKMVTSGKIFEAVAIGIPVIVVQAAGGGAREIIDRYPLGIGTDPYSSEVESAMLEAATRASGRTIEDSSAARAAVRSFERANAMAPMIALANQIVSTR